MSPFLSINKTINYIGETGAKWARSKIVLIIFKEFENSK